MITLRCGCGTFAKARDEDAGRTMKCPGCGSPLTVPVPTPGDDRARIAEVLDTLHAIRARLGWMLALLGVIAGLMVYFYLAAPHR